MQNSDLLEEADSYMPLYVRLERTLRKKILEKELCPGDALPSEKELCDSYGVSRVTVRHALTQLRHDGLVEGFRGRGTFVSFPKVGHPMVSVCSLEERLAARGLSVTHNFLKFSEVRRLAVWVSRLLNLPPTGQIVYRLERQRLVEGKSLGLEEHYFPADLGNRLDAARLETDPVLSLVQEARGPTAHVNRVRLTTTCGLTSMTEARKLGIGEGSPVLIRFHTYLTDANEPVFCGRNIFQDWYQFTLDMEQMPTGQVLMREWD